MISVEYAVGILIAKSFDMKQVRNTTESSGISSTADLTEEMMLQRYFRILPVFSVLTALLIWSGCSIGDDPVISSPPGINSNVENYFPVESGSIRQYSVNRPNGMVDTISFEVGAKVQFGNDFAMEWIAIDEIGGRSVGFVITSPSSIVVYESANDNGETILALPLESGATWERYGESLPVTEEDNNSFGGLITTTNGKGQPVNVDSTSGGKYDGNIGSGKTFPTDGSGTLVVDGFETVVLSNGSSYDGAVKLRNGGLGGVNFYWFAPGTGLVKFVLSGQPDGSEVGATVGELASVILP